MRTVILRGAALASAVVASLLTVTGPASAQAAPAAHRAPSPVVIAEIFYNSPGPDHRTSASLNAEWVTLHNQTGHPVSLSGWTLRDTSHHIYPFGNYSLRAHGTVRIHTGSGRDTQRNLFQNSGNYIWNNTGDTAILRGPAGNNRDRCSYSDPHQHSAEAFC